MKVMSHFRLTPPPRNAQQTLQIQWSDPTINLYSKSESFFVSKLIACKFLFNIFIEVIEIENIELSPTHLK